MKALTVQQPWAWAIVHGGKDVENRTRNLAGSYRGPLAIHSSKTPDPDGLFDPTLAQAVREASSADSHGDRSIWLPGSIIGMVDLWAVHRSRPGCCPNRGARPFGSPWAHDAPWHLCVTEPRPLVVPVPCRGALGLWTLPSGVDDQVTAQLQGRDQ